MNDNFKKQWMDIAEIVDAFRIIPRFILIGYGVLCYNMYLWFTSLEDPTQTQAAFVSIIIGVAGYIIGSYYKTGKDWDKAKELKKEMKEKTDEVLKG